MIGPAAQGITAGEFAELLAAIRADSTYANVHSTLYPRVRSATSSAPTTTTDRGGRARAANRGPGASGAMGA